MLFDQVLEFKRQCKVAERLRRASDTSQVIAAHRIPVDRADLENDTSYDFEGDAQRAYARRATDEFRDLH